MSFKYTPTFLRKLEGLFEEAAYTVRYEKGTFQSGYCLLEHRRIVVVNRFLPTEGRIQALLDILPMIAIEEDLLPTETLKFYQSLGSSQTPENA